jgi:hypothetical protein
MPDALDRDLHREVAEKVADAAYDSGACA